MNLLILGDIMGASGRKVLHKNLPNLILNNKIDFVIVNGENASDDGRGITKDITEELFKVGVDVITSGNHIWDEKETEEFITSEKRLLRPENSLKPVPGKGSNIFISKNKNRLGYGKGFYDRYLNKYLKKFRNILTVGVAFSFQKHHKLPVNKNDIKLNFIITEKGIY